MSLSSLHSIGMLRELLRKWWQVELGLADARGVIHAGTWEAPQAGGNDFCRALLSAPLGRQACERCIRELRSRLRKGRAGQDSMLHSCHLGFGMAACPVRLRGRFEGYVFACGFSNRELSRTRMGRLQAAIGEKLKGIDALEGERVPVLSREDQERLRDMLGQAAREIASAAAVTRRVTDEVEATGVHAFDDLIARSPTMKKLLANMARMAIEPGPVLLFGPPGTGKETLARQLHQAGPRRERPFEVLRKTSNPEQTEKLLFGEAGRTGILESASAGSVYLPAGSWFAPGVQVQLLRLIREGTLVPFGAERAVRCGVRIMLALECSPQEAQTLGLLRPDLADALLPHQLQVPALQERFEDLPGLIEHFARLHEQSFRPEIDPDAMRLLQRYSWPGQLDELEAEVRRLVDPLRAGQRVTVDNISPAIREAAGYGSPLLDALRSVRQLKDAFALVEKELIREGLLRHSGNRSALSRQLGISRSNLISKISRYGLNRKSS